jgi:tricorn protease
MSSQSGYYTYPTIHDNTIVFTCEDDLWSVPASGGVARRLTANPGAAYAPALSPDGTLLAFTGRDEGNPEVYCMPAEGGPAKRLTYLGADSRVCGWRPDGSSILFASSAAQFFHGAYSLYTVTPSGGEPTLLPTGPAVSISYPRGTKDKGAVIARHSADIARWKRYRGGLTGDLWVDPEGTGEWRRLIRLKGNVASPQWLGERIFFVSDHEGIGNLYSCLPTGDDLRRHTSHADYYVRRPATDGRRIVYHAGADLYVYNPEADESQLVQIEFHSPQAQRKRKFVETSRYLEKYKLHPEGHSVAMTVRGHAFSMAHWEGAVTQHGDANGVRYRLASWLNDGKRLIMVSDADGEDGLEIHHADGSGDPDRVEGLDLGQPVALEVSPKHDLVALSNHRNELIVVDLAARTARSLDRSAHDRMRGLAWSPDGRWLAYGFPETQQTTVIKLCRVESGEVWAITRPVLHDVAPAFSPDGQHLYFLSYRDFNPVYDNLHFDLNFPWGMRPYLITLRADLPSPFIPTPRAPGKKGAPSGEQGGKGAEEQTAGGTENGAKGAGGEAAALAAEEMAEADREKEMLVEIDLEGIAERVIAFPVPEGRYGRIVGIKGKALFSSYPVEGALKQTWYPMGTPPAKGKIEVYDFDEQKCDVLVKEITSFDISRDHKTLIYRAGGRLRVLEAGAKPENETEGPGRKSGWLDLDRVKVSIDPPSEWQQMYRQAWRLQRDYFWTEDMSGLDWQAVYQRYWPLLGRVATRREFSDLIWEMQGELGTSHAYEMGGDYPPEPDYPQGFMGADLRYHAESDSFEVTHVVHGDPWDDAASSPLARPGIGVRTGDRLIAVGGRKVGRGLSPGELLVNRAKEEVTLTFARPGEAEPRSVTVKTLSSEGPARYREWVEATRQRVHEATGGRVGYIHIPDMGPKGYAEFHRGYLAEVEREGLIVDVRNNGGGHVSPLLLEKLARRHLGYDVQRWGQPSPYPPESVLGPLVALTNESAGSDGDLFSHAFKLMGLGPLIGTRTWGGVIGIEPRNPLADGGITTQPEYSFWFKDVGWGVENYGTDPDIEVEIAPQDYVAGRDPQLERAIAEIQRLLAEHPPARPDFGDRPRLALPALPPAQREPN